MQGMLELLGWGGYYPHLSFLGGMVTRTIVIGLLYLIQKVVICWSLIAIGDIRKIPRVLVKGERSHRGAQELCQGLKGASWCQGRLWRIQMHRVWLPQHKLQGHWGRCRMLKILYRTISSQTDTMCDLRKGCNGFKHSENLGSMNLFCSIIIMY
jgi:hypothetical protein